MLKKKKETIPPKIIKKKNTRTDVKERKQTNKDTQFTCVKMTLKSLIENNFLNAEKEDKYFVA